MRRLKTAGAEMKQASEWAQNQEWIKHREFEQDSGYMDCVRDIFENPVFHQMDQYIQHGSTTCKEHCIQVSYMSYRICKKNQWDYKSAARAALLHDLFLYDWHTYAKETGHHFHGYTHPKIARDNAAKYFHITEKEQNMILRHMWPLTFIPPKHREGFVLLYADKFCSLAEVVAHIKRWLVFTLGSWDTD